MAFDIRAIFTRALGGREERETHRPVPAPEASTEEEMPTSPVRAASTSAAEPDTEDMLLGGATRATTLIPEGMDAMPSAAMDSTTSRVDDMVFDDEARRVAETAIAAAIVEGDIGPDERADLVESLQEFPGLENFTDDDFRKTMDELREIAGSKDPRGFVAAMEGYLDEVAMELTDPVLRRAAYQLAVYFCAWDGVLTDNETDLLEAIAEAFEILPLEARSLREATLMEAGEEGQIHGVVT